MQTNDNRSIFVYIDLIPYFDCAIKSKIISFKWIM